ncbi:Hypothetical predicted protein [Mytilus galloprovincialis]|uniref:C-type lectin domain-containing protein n=1 Tax=Mytilus galloprovincialis TaxID=29158 RepID=A0A8B6D3G4_MYTGA|nr:Hypothetical predicted protein [Mytilus galloprovincialis]
MYDFSRNMCLLHSDTSIQGRNSVTIQTNETWDFYGIAHEDCTLPGYDSVPSIHACFKHYYKVDSTWVSARDICINDGGDLVIIDTQETYDFLFNYVNCIGKLWFGLRDYKWVNGQPFTNNLGLNILWNNEVDSEDPSDPYYDCGLLGFKSGYKIVDVSCTVKIRRFFVCEIPMIPVS